VQHSDVAMICMFVVFVVWLCGKPCRIYKQRVRKRRETSGVLPGQWVCGLVRSPMDSL
jgi:hypothetical protein